MSPPGSIRKDTRPHHHQSGKDRNEASDKRKAARVTHEGTGGERDPARAMRNGRIFATAIAIMLPLFSRSSYELYRMDF